MFDFTSVDMLIADLLSYFLPKSALSSEYVSITESCYVCKYQQVWRKYRGVTHEICKGFFTSSLIAFIGSAWFNFHGWRTAHAFPLRSKLDRLLESLGAYGVLCTEGLINNGACPPGQAEPYYTASRRVCPNGAVWYMTRERAAFHALDSFMTSDGFTSRPGARPHLAHLQVQLLSPSSQ